MFQWCTVPTASPRDITDRQPAPGIDARLRSRATGCRSAWRLDGSYSAFHLTPRLAASSQDPNAARADGSAPHAQWQLRSAFSASPRATFFVAIFHVGPLEQLQVDAYTRADISAEWRLTSHWAAMAIGQNVFDAAHAEFGGTSCLCSRRGSSPACGWMAFDDRLAALLARLTSRALHSPRFAAGSRPVATLSSRPTSR